MNAQRKCLSALLCWRLELLGVIVAVLVAGSTGCSNSSTLTPVASKDAGSTELDSVPRTDSETEIDLSSEVDSSPELRGRKIPSIGALEFRQNRQFPVCGCPQVLPTPYFCSVEVTVMRVARIQRGQLQPKLWLRRV